MLNKVFTHPYAWFRLPLLIIALSITAACTVNNANPELLLSASEDSLPNDGLTAIAFSVQYGDDDVTDGALIFFEHEGSLQRLDKAIFTSQRPGIYVFFAMFNGHESNHINITVTEDVKIIKLTASSYNIPDDGSTETIFTVSEFGEDITGHAEIYNITGDKPERISGNRFCSDKAGIYRFMAAYDNFTSNEINIYVESPDSFTLPADSKPESTDFTDKVMLVKNTGTGCAYCPMVSAAIKEVQKDVKYGPRMTILEAHNFNSNDPMICPASVRISELFNINSWPLVIYDFKSEITSVNHGSTDNGKENLKINIEQVKKIIDSQWTEQSEAGISAVSKVDGDVIRIKAAVKARITAEYHLQVCLLENNIKYTQNDYAPDAEGYPEDFDPNKHSNVLRAVYDGCDPATSDLTGINLGEIQAGETAETEITITIKDNWLRDNCHLLFYICSKDGDRYIVRNSSSAEIGAKMPFDYNN